MDKKLALNALWIMFHGLMDLVFEVGLTPTPLGTSWDQKYYDWSYFDGPNSFLLITFFRAGSSIH
jgi:hypothetical protein